MTTLALKTRRLELRPFAPNDLEDLYRLYGDPQVMAIRKLGVQTQARTQRQLEDMVAQWSARGFGMWAVLERGSDTFVGECGLRPVGASDPAIELSFGLVPSRWGRGYAPEASTAAVNFGFTVAGLDEIVAIARADNARSRRVLEKLGMKLVRETKGGQASIVRYAIAADAWRPKVVPESPLSKNRVAE